LSQSVTKIIHRQWREFGAVATALWAVLSLG
jgi:hypothetical protein